MDAHYLHDFFHPRGLLLIAGEESGRFLADRIQKNILEGGFRGPFLRRSTREFLEPYPVPGDWIERLSGPPLALIACHPLRVPEVLEACRGPGIRSAVVFSGEVIAETGDRRKFEQEISRAARGVGLRLLGPNCPGIQRPRIGLNATFGLPLARPGGVALVSQSGAISTTILDQYSADHLGFSAVVSPGDAVDTDFGDILNFLATDIETRSILLYMEGVHHARNFLSGLRLAARIKPVIIVKSGRHEIGSLAARHHTGAPLGMDPVFNAALERSGAVRAFSLEQLLSAAEILSSSPRLQGDRLGILTNGGGPGVLAADRAADLGVQIPSLSPETFAENDPVFPEIWTPSNPLDLHFDADADRYARALEATLEDPALDGILILYAPRQNSSAEETSRSLVKVVQEKPGKPVLVSLMGEKGVQNARRILMDQQIPCFPFPEAAVDAFSYLARYWRNQQLLAQLPASGPEGAEDSPADIAKGREILHSAILVNLGNWKKKRFWSCWLHFESDAIFLPPFQEPGSENSGWGFIRIRSSDRSSTSEEAEKTIMPGFNRLSRCPL